MKIIKVKYSGIESAKKAGAKIIKLYLNSSTHEAYEGRKKKSDDYLYGVKAICDNVELLCLACDNKESFKKLDK